MLTEGREIAGSPLSGMPYVDQVLPDGRTERRYLALIPTPANHRMMAAAPGFEQATGIKPIPRSGWPDLVFERRHTDVPILDQDGKGACVPHGGTSAVLLARARSGAPYVALNPWFLYTLINHGVDAGAMA